MPYGGRDHFVLATNANGGDYHVGEAYDQRLRYAIAKLHVDGLSTRAIARQLNISKSGVHKVIRTFIGERHLRPGAQNGAASCPPKLRARELLYLKVRESWHSRGALESPRARPPQRSQCARRSPVR